MAEELDEIFESFDKNRIFKDGSPSMNKIMEKPKGYTLGDALKSSGVLDKLKGEMK
jgi:hypothetical protein